MRGSARNILLDLRALACMPGLDRIADTLRRHDAGSTQTDHASLVIYLAARWRVGSSRELDSLLADQDMPVWEHVRRAALRADRVLSATAPTYDMLYGYRERVRACGPAAFDAMLEDVQMVFTDVGVDIALRLGLLQPGAPDWEQIARGNVIAVDGTLFKPASSVIEHEDGTVVGSRADPSNPAGRGPRSVDVRNYKQNNKGVPLVMATVRDDEWNRRVVLGVKEILAGDERAAAHGVIERVVNAAGVDSVHVVVYDRLFKGVDLDQVLRLGVVPVVPMQAPSDKSRTAWPITEAQSNARYVLPVSRLKNKLKAVELAPVDHHGCLHRVWAIDGSVVIVPAAEDATIETLPSHACEIERLSDGDGYRFVGTYEYECGDAVHHTTIEWTGDARRPKGKVGFATNVVRPISDTDPRFPRLYGYRQDIESTYGTIKRPLHMEGRAISYDPDDFTLDAIGAGLLLNAIAYDLHGHREVAA